VTKKKKGDDLGSVASVTVVSENKKRRTAQIVVRYGLGASKTYHCVVKDDGSFVNKNGDVFKS
jgi:hypothetical protein